MIWRAFGGFSADGLEGVIMSSRVADDFMKGGGEDVVSKAELFGMLIQLAYKTPRGELSPSEDTLPQVLSNSTTRPYMLELIQRR